MMLLLPVVGVVAAIIGALVVQLFWHEKEQDTTTVLPKPKAPQQELMELWDAQLEREENDKK